MSDLRSKLSKLVPGDIIHGRHSAGPSLTCLVEAVEADRIETRRITTQRHITFDIETGVEIDFPECRLDSIEPLPIDVHNVLLGLDRKMRVGRLPINKAEKDALLFLADFYRAHPL
ncbi:MAG: hypothetical protein LCH95_12445 [Proteobacteria bacterium]|nr:hypothetical protein [Pseudomonadota bacterium]